jgi:hypothetical protein
VAVKKFEVVITSPVEVPATVILLALQAYSQIVLEQYCEETGQKVKSRDITIKVKEIE